MNFTFNPFTSRLDAIQPENHWKQLQGTAQSTTGAGVGIFTLTDIPFNSSVYLQYMLTAKLDGADEFRVELVTKRLYRGAAGNVIELAGATTSLSQNFTISPTRAQTLGGGTYALSVGSGGMQTINWDVYVDYIVTTFNS